MWFKDVDDDLATRLPKEQEVGIHGFLAPLPVVVDRERPVRPVLVAEEPHIVDSGEPSKVPFYAAAVLLVRWAILVAVLGLRSPDFPPGSRGRAVVAISVVLFAAALTTSVLTAAKPVKAKEAAAKAETLASPSGGASTEPTTTTGRGLGAADGAVSLAADRSGQLKYNTPALTAKAGKVTVDFTNASPVPHNVTITSGGKNVAATRTLAGGKASVSTTLKPGDYAFLCTIDGHAQAGMKGTLTVK